MKFNLKTLITDLCTYNLWANRELIVSLPENHAVIQQKLTHLCTDEAQWLNRIQGKDPVITQDKIYEGAIDALLKDLVAQSETMLDYVSELSEETLKEQVKFELPGAGDLQMARYEIVQHSVGNSTYQRGEIKTGARV